MWKSFLGDDAAVLARSSGEAPASPRHRAGVDHASRRRPRRKLLISTQVVTAFDGFNHVVRYDDGDAELLNLTGPGREEKFELIIDLTKAPLSEEPAPRDPRTRVKTEPAPPRPPPAATLEAMQRAGIEVTPALSAGCPLTNLGGYGTSSNGRNNARSWMAWCNSQRL